MRTVKEGFIWSRILYSILLVIALPFLGDVSVDAMSLYAHSQNANIILLSLWGVLNVASCALFLVCAGMLGITVSDVIKVYRRTYK